MSKCSFSTQWPRQPNSTYFSALSIAALHRRERTALAGPRCTDVPQQAALATLNGLGVQAKGHQERAHAQYAAHLRRLDEPAPLRVSDQEPYPPSVGEGSAHKGGRVQKRGERQGLLTQHAKDADVDLRGGNLARLSLSRSRGASLGCHRRRQR